MDLPVISFNTSVFLGVMSSTKNIPHLFLEWGARTNYSDLSELVIYDYLDISGKWQRFQDWFENEINANASKVSLIVAVDKNATVYLSQQDSEFFNYLIYN